MTIKKVIAAITLVIITFSANIVFGDTASIPHQFENGTVAVADEVNENFSALKTAIDGNNARIPVLKDGDGAIIGTLLNYNYALRFSIYLPDEYPPLTTLLAPTIYGSYTVINSKHYLFKVNVKTADVIDHSGTFFFSEANCQGNVYLAGFQVVMKDPSSNTIYYVPIGTSFETIKIYSVRYGNGDCSTATTSTYMTVLPANVNDQNITGVPDTKYTLPLSVGTQ